MKEMMTSGDFADVTLVCDDKKKIRAHKNILAACSPVFREIFQIVNSSVVYLKGVSFSEMDSILQFIYLGEARCYETRMNHFFEAGKSLGIKELNKEEDEIGKDVNTLDDSVQINEMEDSEKMDSVDDYQTHHTMDTIKHRPDKSTKVVTVNSDKYYCVDCDKKYADNAGIYRHKKAVHEGVNYSCIHCDYMASRKEHLKHHIKSKHKDIKSFQSNF